MYDQSYPKVWDKLCSAVCSKALGHKVVIMSSKYFIQWLRSRVL